jgi:hypothetical protein
MNWFRHRVRQASLLALIALAINLALSFGHVHALAGRHSEPSASLLLAAIAPAHAGGQTQGHDPSGDTDDLCPICMATTAMGNAVAATPPVLPIVFAYAKVDRQIEPVAALVQPQRPAFQSRGPPIS